MMNTNRIHNYLPIYLLLAFLILLSCHKEKKYSIEPNIKLKFSNDTILFDTVLTTIGSITKTLKVYNPANEHINISNINLKGGNHSQYRVNIDGLATANAINVELAPRDSLHIFIKVLINPTDENTPFIVEDILDFNVNGNKQEVKIIAWGQNANYIIGNIERNGLLYKTIVQKNENIDWIADRPYVIYGMAYIDSNAVLNIPADCKIYFHNQSGIHMAPTAQLNINGELGKEVIFRGDRFDEQYRNMSGYWKGILIEESLNPININYAKIENAEYGIRANGKLYYNGTLSINNTIIRNMTKSALEINNYNTEASNLLIVNSGERLLKIQGGGIHNFTHCSFVNYWNRSFRLDESFFLSSSYSDNDGGTTIHSLAINFANCILDGDETEELSYDYNHSVSNNISFLNCTLKTQTQTNEVSFINCIMNPTDLFVNIEENNFSPLEGSALINNGNPDKSILFPKDLLGNKRLPLPDIGALEFIPLNQK